MGATNFDQVQANLFLGPGLGSISPFARAFFVDGNLGVDSGTGQNPLKPFRTMQYAFNQLRSGDVIYFRGNIVENLSAPAGIFDVSIIGCGNRPRHADAHTSNNGYSAATWKAAVQTDPLLILRQQGWRLSNLLLDAPTSDAAIEFIRDAASGDSERDSSHAEILGCRFASGATGILITGTENVFNVRVEGCTFNDLTDAIKGDTAWRWQIIGNEFHSNTNHVDSGFTQSVIRGNTFGKFTTKSIDLTGGANNVVYTNYLYGTYSNVGGYTAGTGDEWGGNYNSITGGLTAADPA